MSDEADAIDSIKTILSANWSASNTDSITPDFYLSTEQPPRLDFSGGSQTGTAITKVLVYEVSHTTKPNGLGPSHKEATVDRVSIDIRTKQSRSHIRKCYNECRRIFSTRINSPDSSFLQLMPLQKLDFSTIGFWRYVYDVNLLNWTVTR